MIRHLLVSLGITFVTGCAPLPPAKTLQEGAHSPSRQELEELRTLAQNYLNAVREKDIAQIAKYLSPTPGNNQKLSHPWRDITVKSFQINDIHTFNASTINSRGFMAAISVTLQVDTNIKGEFRDILIELSASRSSPTSPYTIDPSLAPYKSQYP